MQRTPPELTALARELRHSSTEAERASVAALAPILSRFTPQMVVSHYIVDLACRSAKVAVELDGGHRAHQIESDGARTLYLEAQG